MSLAAPYWTTYEKSTEAKVEVGSQTASQTRLGVFLASGTDTSEVLLDIDALLQHLHLLKLVGQLEAFYREFSEELREVAEAAYEAQLWHPRRER